MAADVQAAVIGARDPAGQRVQSNLTNHHMHTCTKPRAHTPHTPTKSVPYAHFFTIINEHLLTRHLTWHKNMPAYTHTCAHTHPTDCWTTNLQLYMSNPTWSWPGPSPLLASWCARGGDNSWLWPEECEPMLLHVAEGWEMAEQIEVSCSTHSWPPHPKRRPECVFIRNKRPNDAAAGLKLL